MQQTRNMMTISLRLLLAALAMSPVAQAQEVEQVEAPAVHRYMVVRTFPPGALEGLDDEAKQQVNANNTAHEVRWIRSYANADLTRTFCIYEGSSEEAIRRAAEANDIPVDYIVEIPIDLTP